MVRIFLLFLLCCSLAKGAGDDLVVSARIVETGHTSGDGRGAIIVLATVRNTSAAPKRISMMTCSWNDSWRVSPTEVFVIPIWACDSNYSLEETFPAKGGFSFRFQIEARSPAAKIAGTKLKLGFICAQDSRTLLETLGEADPGLPMVWSNELTVPALADEILMVRGERTDLLPGQTAQPTSAGLPKN